MQNLRTSANKGSNDAYDVSVSLTEKEGTSAVLLQSGLNLSWWADTMECYTYLRNVTDQLSDGKTPYERRFGQPFKAPIIPFGSLAEYHFVAAKDQSRIHQF